MTQTPDRITESNDQTIVGGGHVAYEIDATERRAQSLSSKLETAIEAFNARQFHHAPKESVGPKRAHTEYKLRAITDAIAEANERPSFTKHIDGELSYVVTEGYYPDEYTHFVDLTDIPADQRHRALSTVQNTLCRHGYIVNSLRSGDDGTLEKLHIVSLAWVYDARSHGRTAADE
ncbi:hypothetical protein [Natrinema versiforme]|uniref:Uncharacterized protein n=1 Tax=Natrinema versiforme JCM 10478 TaxID=1227496 RepID=L9Y5F9_9EURY|nr:hypothetical protein [Natrinema versiforme]ELY68891.1 hypothetical protein C489_05978 [Natrinema versiforme JCM 10478]